MHIITSWVGTTDGNVISSTFPFLMAVMLDWMARLLRGPHPQVPYMEHSVIWEIYETDV